MKKTGKAAAILFALAVTATAGNIFMTVHHTDKATCGAFSVEADAANPMAIWDEKPHDLIVEHRADMGVKNREVKGVEVAGEKERDIITEVREILAGKEPDVEVIDEALKAILPDNGYTVTVTN